MRLHKLIIVLLIFLIAGCEGQNVKYPAPSAVYNTHNSKTLSKPKTINKPSRKPKNKGICLAVSDISANRLSRAEVRLKSLENANLSNKAYAQVYSLMSLVRFRRHLRYKDYAEIAYAYDEDNRLARYMLKKRPIFEIALKIAKDWCR
ncbi:hypothetical protein [Hippea sp. KM1]|uniref:hypothetical protein n=1 Tax=Hippea sp. KM1 TaxID=944481 RepID=UPI0012EC0600|nr:hypothetical protein [Hippea sp. KM1]